MCAGTQEAGGLKVLELILSKLGGALVDKVFGGVVEISKAYINKQINETDAKKQFLMLFTGAAKEIEVTHSNDLRETYKVFWTVADTDKSNIMKRMWAVALGSQIFVLFWSQWVVPMLYSYGWLGEKGWHAGTSAEWAYLIVVALLGMGPVVLRSGPGGGNYMDKAKEMWGKK